MCRVIFMKLSDAQDETPPFMKLVMVMVAWINGCADTELNFLNGSRETETSRGNKLNNATGLIYSVSESR